MPASATAAAAAAAAAGADLAPGPAVATAAAAAAGADYFIVHGAVSTQHPATLIEAWWHAYHYFKKHPPPGRFSFVGYPKPDINYKPKLWWTKWSMKVIGVRAPRRNDAAVGRAALIGA